MSLSAESEAPPRIPLGRLPELAGCLRRHGLRVTAADEADMAALGIQLLAYGTGIDAESLRLQLRALLCKSRPDCAIFDLQWQLFHSQISIPTAPDSGGSSDSSKAAKSRWQRNKRVGLATLLLGCAALAAWWHFRAGTTVPVTAPGHAPAPEALNPAQPEKTAARAPAQREIDRQTDITGQHATPVSPLFDPLNNTRDLLLAVLGLIGLLAAGARLRSYAVKGRAAAQDDQQIIALRPPTEPEAHQELQARTIQRLRDQQWRVFRRIDPLASINECARQTGFPQPRYLERRVAPAYLFLVEQKHRHDHWAGLVMNWIMRLRLRGVDLETYVYSDSPDKLVCTHERWPRPASSLGSVLRGSRCNRIVLFCSDLEMASPYTGSLLSWVRDLGEFYLPLAVVLPARWPVSRGIQRLKLHQHAEVFEFDRHCGDALATWFSSSDDARARPFRDPHRSGSLQAFAGLERAQPETVSALMGDLATTLSPGALLLLSACAVYPQIHRSLTLILAKGLCDCGEIPATDHTAVLAEVSALPWMRSAQMPDWLRKPLVDGLSKAQRDTITTVLHASMSTGTVLTKDPGQLQLSRHGTAQALGTKSAIRRQLGETICQSASGGALGFLLPRWTGASLTWSRLSRFQRLPTDHAQGPRTLAERRFANRVRIVTAFSIVVFGLLGWRLTLMHLNERLAEMARRLAASRIILPAERGKIWDAGGELLAISEDTFSVALDRVVARDLLQARIAVARAEGITSSKVRAQYNDTEILKRYEAQILAVAQQLEKTVPGIYGAVRGVLVQDTRAEVTVARRISSDDAEVLRREVSEARMPGVFRLRTSRGRVYPGSIALEVLGNVDQNEKGVDGVEKSQDALLAGKDGYQDIERDLRGRLLALFRGDVKEAINGRDIHLTLRADLQAEIQALLYRATQKHRPRSAAAIVMDAQSGKIRAMAQFPSVTNAGGGGLMRNIAIADHFEPGSLLTFVPLAAALDAGKITPDSIIDTGNGALNEAGANLRDSKPYGAISVTDVIVNSSNIGAYKIAQNFGLNRFVETLRQFGFGQRTGIELPGEGQGVFRPTSWTSNSFSRAAIGYEIAATPLQMLCAMSIVANGGVLVPPTIIEGIADNEGELRPPARPEPVRVISPQAAEQTTQCLTAAVARGTSAGASISGYAVAAKSSISQRYDGRTRSYSPGHYNMSCVGFLPSQSPKLVAFVFMEDPVVTDETPALENNYSARLFSEIMGAAVAATHLPKDPSKNPEAFGRGIQDSK